MGQNGSRTRSGGLGRETVPELLKPPRPNVGDVVTRTGRDVRTNRDASGLYSRSTLEANTPCLVALDGAQRGKRHDLHQEAVVVGRSGTADIVLADEGVSRRHCEISYSGINYLIRDLGSANGTFVNNERVENERRLCDGDIIQVCHCTLKFLSQGNIEHHYHEELYNLASTDPSTGLRNEKFFFEMLTEELIRAMPRGRRVGVALLELDHYLDICREFGRVVASDMVRAVGTVISEYVHAPELLARRAGAQFALLLPEVDLTQAQTKVSTICAEAIRRKGILAGTRVVFTLSAGVIVAQQPGHLADGLLRAAELRLEQALASGGGRVDALELGEMLPPATRATLLARATPLPPVRPIPETWFKQRLVAELEGFDESSKVILGACGLRDALALIVEEGRPAVDRCRAILLEQLVALSDARPVITQAAEGVFLYFRTVRRNEDLQRQQRRLAKAFAAALAKQPLTPRRVELVQSLMSTEDHEAGVDDFMDRVLRRLDRLPVADRGLALRPFPVARALRRMETADGAAARLNELHAATDTVLRYLTNIALADLVLTVDPSSELVGWLSQQVGKPFSTGLYIGVLRKCVNDGRATAGPIMKSIGQALERPDAGRTNTFARFDELVKLRNATVHGAPAGSEAAARHLLSTVQPLFDRVIEDLAVLDQQQLLTVTGLEFRGGSFHCNIRDHSGPDQLFSVDQRKTSTPVENGTYVLSRRGDDWLPLHPFVRFEHCGACGQSELFWNQVLSFDSETIYHSMITAHRLSAEVVLDKVPAWFRRDVSRGLMTLPPGPAVPRPPAALRRVDSRDTVMFRTEDVRRAMDAARREREEGDGEDDGAGDAS
ncbi:MAG: GGDEF domain-containing protein [Deltaproteobacteria bacterium]|nr:GGDEF domain-containing protein [Deltaproteobacteria bacterium]